MYGRSIDEKVYGFLTGSGDGCLSFFDAGLACTGSGGIRTGSALPESN
jgi:hypothetical protein